MTTPVISHYRIIEQLGVGGMGEVYLAEDIRLGRRVALKILPTDFIGNEDRVRRFQQEARAASALNHPNILTIYEIGQTDPSAYFIATEFIEGETLRERMDKGRLPLSEALEYAVQIASALAASHTAGITHRDIKPENIMVRADGYIKVLDFGLAKFTEKKDASHTVDEEAVTRARVRTNPGMVMGTVSYMSPEQVRGKQTDARTDLWSLGVVLYEMLTGHLPFAGETLNDSIAAILTKEPPLLVQYISDVPTELQRIVRKALTKDRDERYQTARDLMIDLKSLRRDLDLQSEIERSSAPHITDKPAVETSAGKWTQTFAKDELARTKAISDAATNEPQRKTSSAEYAVNEIRRHKTGAAIVVALVALMVAGIGYGIYRYFGSQKKTAPSSAAMKLTRLTNTGKASDAAISPDGRYVVHVQDDGGQQSLWVRQVATQSNVQIVPPAAVWYQGLTFTPDGNYIYYVTISNDIPQRALYQVPVLGGAPKKLLVNLINEPITFSPDGKQFAFVRREAGKEDALMITNADGGGERKLVAYQPPEELHIPAWSPDGKTIACSIRNDTSNDTSIFEVRVENGERKSLTSQRWFRIGRIGWLADGSGLLILAPTDNGLSYQIWQLSYPDGAARRITNDLNTYQSMSLTADSSALAAVQHERLANIWTVPSGVDLSSQANRNGFPLDASRARQVTSGTGKFEAYGISWTPDGRIVYGSDASGNLDIWMIDADGSNQKQLTANARNNLRPSVSPDGRFIVFLSDRSGRPHLWKMDIDGGNPQQLTNGSSGEDEPEISPDGRWVLYLNVYGGQTAWKVPVDGGEAQQLTDKHVIRLTVSPDGKFIACNYKDKNYPRWQIAIIPSEGGQPIKTFDVVPTYNAQYPIRWTPDGRAIAYIDTQKGVSNIWAQPIDGGKPVQLTDFKSDRIFNFVWSRDGRQLALARGVENNDVVLINNFK